MKTDFDLEVLCGANKTATASIVGNDRFSEPYVRISVGDGVMINGGYVMCIKDKDLERFAVNILKAIGSKKLK